MFESQTSTQVTLFAVFSSVFLISTAVQFYFLWRNNRHKIVRVRGIPSILICALGIIFILLSCLVLPLFNSPCVSVSFFGILGTAVTLAFTIERCVLIVGQFKIVMEAKELASDLNGRKNDLLDLNQKSRFLRHRKFFHNGLISWTKFVASLLALALSLPVLLYVYLTHPVEWVFAPFYTEQCQHVIIDSFKGVAISCTFGSMFVGMISKHLIAVQENFHFKQEMLYQAIIGSIIGGYYFMYAFIPNFPACIGMPITITFLVVGGILSMFSFFTLVGYLSVKVHEEDTFSFKKNAKLVAVEIEEARNYSQKLTVILKNEKSLQLFEVFLCKEFSVENLFFWKAVESLKQRVSHGLLSEAEVLQESKRIYEAFCSTSAQLNINISSDTRSLLINTLDETKQELAEKLEPAQLVKRCLEGFGKAQREIFVLLSNDSLRRFLRSSEYQNFIIESGHQSNNGGSWRKSISIKLSSVSKSVGNIVDANSPSHQSSDNQVASVVSPLSRTISL
jgi:hypothetical protein